MLDARYSDAQTLSSTHARQEASTLLKKVKQIDSPPDLPQVAPQFICRLTMDFDDTRCKTFTSSIVKVLQILSLTYRLYIVYRQSPLDRSCRALSGRFKFTVRRQKFDKDSLFFIPLPSEEVTI